MKAFLSVVTLGIFPLLLLIGWLGYWMLVGLFWAIKITIILASQLGAYTIAAWHDRQKRAHPATTSSPRG